MHWIYLIHEFHNLSWINEINELFHVILIYWDAPVYVCMCICIYCIYMCICLCICVCMCIYCIYMCICLCICVCMCIYIYIYIYILYSIYIYYIFMYIYTILPKVLGRPLLMNRSLVLLLRIKSLVFGDEFWAQGLHLKSHQRCSAGIRTWFYADQVLPHWLNQSFLLEPCLIRRCMSR